MRRAVALFALFCILLCLLSCAGPHSPAPPAAPDLFHYYGLKSFAGLELYVWNSDEMLCYGLMSHTVGPKSEAEFEALRAAPATFAQMTDILRSYGQVDIALMDLDGSVTGEQLSYIRDQFVAVGLPVR